MHTLLAYLFHLIHSIGDQRIIFRALSAFLPGDVVENATQQVNVDDIKEQYERQMRNFLSGASREQDRRHRIFAEASLLNVNVMQTRDTTRRETGDRRVRFVSQSCIAECRIIDKTEEVSRSFVIVAMVMK